MLNIRSSNYPGSCQVRRRTIFSVGSCIKRERIQVRIKKGTCILQGCDLETKEKPKRGFLRFELAAIAKCHIHAMPFTTPFSQHPSLVAFHSLVHKGK